jgi:hypothetical protein
MFGVVQHLDLGAGGKAAAVAYGEVHSGGGLSALERLGVGTGTGQHAGESIRQAGTKNESAAGPRVFRADGPGFGPSAQVGPRA